MAAARSEKQDSGASRVAELRRQAERAVAEGRIDEAFSCFEALGTLLPDDAGNCHNIALACLQQAERHLKLGDHDRAAAWLEKAVPYLGKAPDFRTPISHSLGHLSQYFWHQRRDARKAAELSRLSMRADRDDGQVRINHEDMLCYSFARAELVDFSDELRPEELATKVFITCFPKSGSTFLSNAMQALTGFERMIATYNFWENEQELYPPSFLRMARQNAVVQIHAKASMPNMHILQAFAIRPVVLVRNIFDVLLSWKEFLDQGAWINTYCKEYRELSEEERFAFVVDDRAPWYLQFFSSWTYATANRLLDAKFITYEKMIADKAGTLAALCDWYGLVKTGDEIAAAIGKTDRTGQTRFNKGIVGRGAKALTDAQKARITEMARRYYPSVDFSPIGLPRAG
ncbi:MAG: sulfotransferase domain-containing protein [Pseudomonadota bacterium]